MLDNEERSLLTLAQTYGDGLSLSGPKIGRRVKEVAKRLIQYGYLGGKMSSLSLTDAGRKALEP